MSSVVPHIALLDLEFERLSCQLRGGDETALKLDSQRKVIRAKMDGPGPLDVLRTIFDLTEAQSDILLLAALADQRPKLAEALQAHAFANRGLLTRGVIAKSFPDLPLAHLHLTSGLLENALLSIEPGGRRYESPIRVSEVVLDYLRGHLGWSNEIRSRKLSIHETGPLSDTSLSMRLGSAYLQARQSGEAPIFYAETPDPLPWVRATRQAMAAMGGQLLYFDPLALPQDPVERQDLSRALCRDLALNAAALAVRMPASDQPSDLIWSWLENLNIPVYAFGGRTPTVVAKPLVSFAPHNSTVESRRKIWADALADPAAGALADPAANDGHIADVSQHFALSACDIRKSADAVRYGVQPDIWTSARQTAASALGPLAQRVDPLAYMKDLILPDAQMQSLQQMASFLRHRRQVTREWGFAAKSARGLGMAAIFYGVSGTGKTTAAEVVIREMQAGQGGRTDLYRVDTASLVSKYIGETAKNMMRIFEAGERAGAALLFDEAEGLFAKRATQARDSLDKHANAELGVLLQCLENYSGVAILTTNMRQMIDEAFLRRFRFAVEFPFPDRSSRSEIWKRVIPDALPHEALDWTALGELSLSGGSIRSIAINSAYLAASESVPMNMGHIAKATRLEFAKLERPAPETELRRWAA